METQAHPQAVAANLSQDEMQFSPNLVAALSYVCPLVGIVALNAKPYNCDAHIRFHSWQSILYAVVATLGYTALSIVSAIVGMIMVMILGSLNLLAVLAFGTKIVSLGFAVLALGLFLAWAFLVFQAATGKRFSIPLIGKHAERLASQG